MKNKGFWAEFWSADNSKVNTMTVIGFMVAAPFALISFAALVYHIFYLGKGLDSPSVQLLLGIFGAATGGATASFFSRSVYGTIQSSLTAEGKPKALPKKG